MSLLRIGVVVIREVNKSNNKMTQFTIGKTFLLDLKDPLTKKFLDATLDPVFGFVKLIRFGWSTCSNKLHKSCVQIKW
jgi:hypothetical protein